jgi:cell division protein FtsA
VIAVSRPDGEIGPDDVSRVIEASQMVSSPPNYEILHVIARNFSVDQQTGVKDPVGMTGIRLEVDAHIIQGLSTHLRNISKVVFRTGVDIDDIVLSVLAASEAVLSRRQKELGVCLLSIGGMTTSLAVFEEGDLLSTAVLPVGGAHITNDIAIGLRTSIDLAEIVKREYGSASAAKVTRKDEVSMAEIAPLETGVFSRRYVAEIIQARLEEIFELADKELVKTNKSGMLPAGVVLTGGGSQISGVQDVAKSVFRLPAAMGVSLELPSAIEKIKEPEMSAALGLVLWWHAAERDHGSSGRGRGLGNFGKFGGKLSGWLKGLFR